MKKNFFLLSVMAILSCLVFMNYPKDTAYAQKIPHKTLNSTDAWQVANLNELFKAPKTYRFDKNELEQMLDKPNLKEFRFQLGVANNTLQVTCIGLDANKQELVAFAEGTVQNNTLEFPQNTEAFNKPNDINELANKHVLDNKQAISYLKNWKAAQQDIAQLEAKLSYEGTRIKHYTITKEAISLLMNQENVTAVALAWGLNTDNKMTTVFLGQDAEGTILMPNKANMALDFTRPCPTACDPIKDDLLLLAIN
jgi:hypothetical protein